MWFASWAGVSIYHMQCNATLELSIKQYFEWYWLFWHYSMVCSDRQKPWPDLALHKVHGFPWLSCFLAIVTLTHKDISITVGGGNTAFHYLSSLHLWWLYNTTSFFQRHKLDHKNEIRICGAYLTIRRVISQFNL